MSLPANVLGSVTGIILWSASWLQGILLAYYLCNFWKLRRDTVYIKRRGDIATAYTICIIIIFILGYPLRLLLHWPWKMSLIPYPSLPYTILTILDDLIFATFYYSSTFITILRYWLIYYDIKFSISCQNLEWKNCIKSDVDSTDHNDTRMEKWFIDHRKNYGNQSFLMKRVMFITCIISVSSVTSSLMYEFGKITVQLWLLLNIPVYLFCGGLIVYIQRKMPEFDDKIYLHKEGKLLSWVWIIAAVLYGSVSIAEMWIRRSIITWFLSELISMIGLFSIAFISTYWVIKQVKVDDTLNKLEIEAASASRAIHRVTLQMIFSDKDLFGLFMQHLVKEFSIECLLSVIEFTQFKKHAMEAFNTTNTNTSSNTDECNKRNSLLIFPEGVPLSDIVYGNEAFNTPQHIEIEVSQLATSERDESLLLLFKVKAHKLYQKYIAIGSGFEINIAYRLRGDLTKLLHEYDKCINNDELTEKKLIHIYDECIEAMIRLLNASRSRFLAQNTFYISKTKKLGE